jgi:DNA adenine methylase
MPNSLVAPVLKWVGGKRQLLPEIRRYIPNNITTYYEPFVGGGAVLFDLQPRRAVVNDVNSELINLYEVIRDNVEELIDELGTYENTSEFFYAKREEDRNEELYNQLTNIQKGARVHYLNKTCYNGLFRVNSAGQFNSPFGAYKNPNIKNEIVLRAVSRYFNKSQIRFTCGDYEDSLRGIRRGSFVYFDPPYDPISDSSNFTGYARGGFDREQQIRLRDVCRRLNARGIRFMLSNSSTEFTRELYREFNVVIVQAKRSINSDGENRGEVDEILVMNYDI